MTPIPCLRADILGGAFVHERWSDLTDSRLIALVDSSYTATLVAKALASKESRDSGRSWVVTNSYGGEQQIWSRKRIDAEADKPGDPA